MVLDRVQTVAGEVVKQAQPQPVGRLPVSQRNLRIVQQGIWEAVNGERGTGRRGRLAGIEIAGKTGTSQVVGRRQTADARDDIVPPHERPHAWFVCYAPFAAPRIAVAVLVENGEHGSSAAAPIAREMVRTYLRHPPPEQRLAAALGSLEPSNP
jgi:penicillin-binding protein 2